MEDPAVPLLGPEFDLRTYRAGGPGLSTELTPWKVVGLLLARVTPRSLQCHIRQIPKPTAFKGSGHSVRSNHNSILRRDSQRRPIPGGYFVAFHERLIDTSFFGWGLGCHLS